MKARFWTHIVGLCAILAAGCVDPAGMGPEINTQSASLTTGVAGQVRLGPISPVSREGEENSAPMPDATIVIEREGGGILGHVVSDADGLFFVTLAAGTYVFTPQKTSKSIYPGIPPAERVTVPSEGVVNVHFEYDTGIR